MYTRLFNMIRVIMTFLFVSLYITGHAIVRHNRWRHGAMNDIPVDFDSPNALSLLWEDNAFEDGIVIPDPSK
jgi:hypothetical protein